MLMNIVLIIYMVHLVFIVFLLIMLLCLIIRQKTAETKIDVMSKEYEIRLYQWVEEQTQKLPLKSKK